MFLIRDRGHGRVTIDGAGNPVHTYPFDDGAGPRELPPRAAHDGACMHEAAGAQEIVTLHRKRLHWTRDSGESIDDYAARVIAAPLSPFEHATFSLHHMGSARMGKDPKTSVAGPFGELHDTPRRLDRRRVGVPDRERDQPDADDDGAGAPDRGGDRGGWP